MQDLRRPEGDYVSPDRAHDFAGRAVDGWLGIKPGWTRLSFSFYLSEPVFQYIVEAVHLVAAHGARLLPDYRFDPRSGLWSHRNAPAPPAGIAELWFDRCFDDGERTRVEVRRGLPDGDLATYLREAAAILA